MTGKIEHASHDEAPVAPPADFAARANVTEQQYRDMYARSMQDPEGFWGDTARELHWHAPWDRVLDWQSPHAQWFVGGRTNIAYNALDRQVQRGLGDRRAIVWEGENGDIRTYTYAELLEQVKRAANALLNLGVVSGDRVTLYLPMIPEAAIAMLACARIGATHSVVFGGFSVSALADRIQNAQSRVLITADASYRRGTLVPLKGNADAAAAQLPS